jgi:E3 ubiquitin-protein ligase UBR4
LVREGYRFQPGKVLAIYTFTRRCALEEAEKGARKTMGFSTVSHFNLVHVDCHLAAVRQVPVPIYLYVSFYNVCHFNSG